MTDPAGPPLPEDVSGKKALASLIREEISSALGKLFDGGKADIKDDAPQPGGQPRVPESRREEADIRAQMRAELARLRREEAAAAEQQSAGERITALEKVLTPPQENAPAEPRGWKKRMWD